MTRSQTRRKAPTFTLYLGPVLRLIKRYWLQMQIKGWERGLDVIQRERDNSYKAEKVIHTEIALAKSALNDLK